MLKTVIQKIRQIQSEKSGAVAVEYVLIAATTSLVLATAMPGIQSSLGTLYSAITGYF